MKKKIPYGHHEMENTDIEAVASALKAWSITQGQICEDFGQAIADYTGSKYGIAVSSGTAALHMAVTAIGIKPGDEVITTPITFAATATSAIYQGASVKLVDIDPFSLNLDHSKIEEIISHKTKAIIPIDFRGHPAPLVEINNIAKKYNIKVIEDGSHSIGSSYYDAGKKFMCGDGAHVDICTFSFHPVKHITTGEGGAILTNNFKMYKKLELLRKHGIDRNKSMFNKEKRIGSWIYDLNDIGFNYRLTEFQAALGLSQLKRIESYKARRRLIVEYYNEAFEEYKELITPYESKNVNSNFHIYTLQIKNNKYFDRYDLYSYLEKHNYLPMVHYIPLHFLTYFKKTLGYKKGDFPNAEKYYKQALSIPLYPSLDDTQMEEVVSTIKTFINSKKSKKH